MLLCGKSTMRTKTEMSDSGEFIKLQNKEIREQVFEQLLMKITMGEWKPGTKIPSENELSNAMGVSRISVREAIQKLVAINLVETFRGKGTYVKSFSANNYLKAMTPMLFLSRDDIKSVVEYRKILEIGIIDIFMKHVEKRDIDALKKILQKMEYFYDKRNLSKYKEYDVSFHMKLYEMTDNPFIIKISSIVRDVINSAIAGALTEEGAREGIEFHSQILKFIEENNTVQLKKITNELFEKVEEEIERIEV